jgi:hypothetical protein
MSVSENEQGEKVINIEPQPLAEITPIETLNIDLLSTPQEMVILGIGADVRVYTAEYMSMPVALKIYNQINSDQFVRESAFYNKVSSSRVTHPHIINCMGISS